jgi:hypothetical protein
VWYFLSGRYNIVKGTEQMQKYAHNYSTIRYFKLEIQGIFKALFVIFSRQTIHIDSVKYRWWGYTHQNYYHL